MYIGQWSFRKTGTMGTLASQAEIGVWAQVAGRFCGAREYHPQKKFAIVYATSCNTVHFCPENGLECVLKHFNDGNDVLIRSSSFSALGTALPLRTTLDIGVFAERVTVADAVGRNGRASCIDDGPKRSRSSCAVHLASTASGSRAGVRRGRFDESAREGKRIPALLYISSDSCSFRRRRLYYFFAYDWPNHTDVSRD